MSYAASRIFGTITCILIFTATLLNGQKQNTNTPAIINFTNPTDTSSTAPTIRLYGDTGGAYVDKSATVSADNISVFFFPSGNAGLDTTTSNVRTLTLDLSQAIQVPTGISQSPPFEGDTKGSITVNLSQQLLTSPGGTCCQGGGLLGMGSTGISRMGLTFPDPQGRPILWTIKWGAGVTDATYTCNLTTVHNDQTWTIGNLSSGSRSCAELDYQSTAKGKSGPVNVYGYYDLPFQFTIQKAH